MSVIFHFSRYITAVMSVDCRHSCEKSLIFFVYKLLIMISCCCGIGQVVVLYCSFPVIAAKTPLVLRDRCSWYSCTYTQTCYSCYRDQRVLVGRQPPQLITAAVLLPACRCRWQPVHPRHSY